MKHRIKRIILIGAMHTLVYLFFLPHIILRGIHGDVAKIFVRVAVSVLMITITIVIVRRDNERIRRQKEKETDSNSKPE